MGEDTAFRIYAHIRGMSLKELRGQPEPGLSRAGRTDNTAVEISGVGRDFGPGVHSQKFRPGQYHVVFKLRVYEWGYVFGRSPTGRAVFHVLPEFLCVLHFVIDHQPEHQGPHKAHQQIEASEVRRDCPESRAYGFHHTYELRAEVRTFREAVGRPHLAEEPENEQVREVGNHIFFDFGVHRSCTASLVFSRSFCRGLTRPIACWSPRRIEGLSFWRAITRLVYSENAAVMASACPALKNRR